MILTWAFENFKAVGNKQELALRPLTVLTGLNSSGKSSLLQSVLLLAQTLGNQARSKPLVLNGYRVQLGTFQEVHHSTAQAPSLTLGFQLAAPAQIRQSPRSALGPIGPRSNRMEDALRVVEVAATFRPAPPGDLSGGAVSRSEVALSSATIKVQVDRERAQARSMAFRSMRTAAREDSIASITALLEPLDDSTLEQLLQDVSPPYRAVAPSADTGSYRLSLVSVGEKGEHRAEFLVSLSHFLPDLVVGKFDLRLRTQEAIDSIVALSLPYTLTLDGVARRIPAPPSPSSLLSSVSPRMLLDPLLSAAARSQITRFRHDHPEAPPFEGETTVDFLDWIRAFSSPTEVAVKDTQLLCRSVLQDAARAQEDPTTPFGLEVSRNTPDVEILDAAARYVTTFFAEFIRYLGPLRAEPQVVHRFAPSGVPDDVGVRGEYAAAVYEANRETRIVSWDPESGSEKHMSLENAVNAWIRYLGVANHVSTEEAGMAGVSWLIRQVPGAPDRTLPAVGVGVSQVLPIIVAGLLAPRDALVMFEQPELHLHPRSQARLADFFYGLTRTGKQCIVETHSENLVNQLRYRIVQGGQGARDSIAIIFVSQDEQGETHFEDIQISGSGNILNWPDGFFDENVRQEDRITRERFVSGTNAR